MYMYWINIKFGSDINVRIFKGHQQHYKSDIVKKCLWTNKQSKSLQSLIPLCELFGYMYYRRC